MSVLVIALSICDATLWKPGSVGLVFPQARVALWELELLCWRWRDHYVLAVSFGPCCKQIPEAYQRLPRKEVFSLSFESVSEKHRLQVHAPCAWSQLVTCNSGVHAL